jgi:hypothetical protein
VATRITLELPQSASNRLIEGYRSRDPVLFEMFREFGVIAIAAHDEHALAQWENEGGAYPA